MKEEEAKEYIFLCKILFIYLFVLFDDPSCTSD